ncbi:pseudouridine synthase, RluA family protein [Bacillus methanolicus MGA3]|nr:pseudouridine synthase, RluA family protein [Bacillus methanolicus MGA3]
MKTNRKGYWFEIIIPSEWAGISIDHLFRSKWKASKKQIHSLRMEKAVLLNRKQSDWSSPLRKGDLLQIKLFEPTEDYGYIPAYFDVQVLYEDEHLIIFNKPAGMDTHPNEAGQTNTLANAAAFYLQAKGEAVKIKHIHRLDRDTTGAVLFAKHSLAGSILDRMLEERLIKRTYLAITEGFFQKQSGIINLPIGRDRHHPTRRRVSATGQTAVTKYNVVHILKEDKLSIVKCQLDTGRTHQIRVHLSSIGHPLAGDVLYGGKPIFKRPALHAAKLEFTHPFTRENVVCHAPFIDEPPIFKDVDPFTI